MTESYRPGSSRAWYVFIAERSEEPYLTRIGIIGPGTTMESIEPLVEAVSTGDATTLANLMRKRPPGEASGYTTDGWTLLHLAPSAAVAAVLLAAGADINARNRHNQYGPGNSPLHSAVYFNRLDVVRLLLDQGANVNHADDAGWRPLHIAAFNAWLEAAGMLIQSGADCSVQTSADAPAAPAGMTPLDLAKLPRRQRDDGSPVSDAESAEIVRLLTAT